MFVAPPGECSKLCVRLLVWWKKEKPCRAILVPMGLFFEFASLVLIEESLGWKALYFAAQRDPYDTLFMMFVKSVHSKKVIVKLNISAFDSRMRESAYKGVLFSWSDVLIRFVIQDLIRNIFEITRSSLELPLSAVMLYSEIDRSQVDCQG